MAQRIQATLPLLQRALAGDNEASSALLHFYRQRLERFLAGRLPSASRSLLDTPDLVQEILARAWVRLPEFEHRGPGSFWSFLRASALNAVADEYRRAARGPAHRYLDDTSAEDSTSTGRSPLQHMESTESFSAYEAALDKLDERLRTAIQLRMELGSTFEQVALECGYPSSEAARKAVSRGLQELARALLRDS
jgi:RNA polymerase sigma factor (sigma-70 family)